MNSQLKSTRLILTVVVSALFFSIFIMTGKNLIKNFQHPSEMITSGAVSTGAQGGNVTYANVTKINQSGHWQGYFGEITVDASSSTPSVTARGGNVTELNLILPCLGNEIYASTENTIDFENILAGTKEAVDAFLNLSSSHLESGSKVFTATRDFVVSSTLITAVPSTYMKVSGSSNSPFALGVLNQSDVLVFVNNVSLNTIGFNGNTHDYQIMIPVNQSELTYYFFSDCEAVPPTPAPAPAPAPAAAARAGKSLLPVEEEKPISIEILEKEGKLIATGYPIAITVLKGEKKSTTIEVVNIGEGKVDNIYLFVTGLPLDTFIITPQKYGLLLPNEKQAFLVEFQGNLEAGTYPIQVVVVSEQGSSFIEGVLIVKDIQKEQKLPLAGAATGLVAQYGKILLLLLLLILLLIGFALWHLLKKHYEEYHSCTVEDLLHHHEENDRVKVRGKIRPLGKSKETFFSRLEDKTGEIDVFTDLLLKGNVEVKGIVKRDAEQHKYIKGIEIKEYFQKKKRRR